MFALVVGLCAFSGGASVGFVIGALLASGRGQDLEFAYRRLRAAVREVLNERPPLLYDPQVLEEAWSKLRCAIEETEAVAFPECAAKTAEAKIE
jgi:hypothetical protein